MTKMMRVQEVAKKLGVHPSTVRTWTNEGKIPCLRLGKRTLIYSQDDIDEFLEARHNVTPPAAETGEPEILFACGADGVLRRVK